MIRVIPSSHHLPDTSPYTSFAFVTSYVIALGVCINANNVEVKFFISRVKFEFPRRDFQFRGIQSYTRPRKCRQRHRRQKTEHDEQSKCSRIHVFNVLYNGLWNGGQLVVGAGGRFVYALFILIIRQSSRTLKLKLDEFLGPVRRGGMVSG